MFLFIALYVILVIIRPQDYPALVDSMPFPLMPSMLALGLLGWLISTRKRFDAPQYLLLLLFLLVVMLSKVVNGWPGGAIEQLGQFGPVVVAYVLLANATTTLVQVRRMMAVFALCATVLALHGVQQVMTGVSWTGVEFSQGSRIQYVGIFNDPNDLGLLFVMCLPMAGYLSGRGGMLGLRRLFWLAVAALLVYAIVLTDSRGTMLAAALVVGLYVWRRFNLFAAATVGAIGLAVLMAIPSRLQEIDASESSAAGRVDAWYEGFLMFFSRPILGIGAGNFADYNTITAHNSFVLVLAETGIVGFTLWFAFVGYGFLMMGAVLRYRPELADAAAERAWRDERAIAATLLLAQSGFFFAAFFLSRSYVVLLYLLAALALGYYSGACDRYPGLPRFHLSEDFWRWGVRALLAVIGLYVLVRILLVTA